MEKNGKAGEAGMKNEPNKITATLKVIISGEFYDDEASEETLRYCVEQDLEDVGFDVDVELLKEQDAKQAIKQTYHVMINRDYENPVEVTRYDWLCPTCKSLLCRDIDVVDDNYHFCKVCGQAVKWE